MPDKKDELITEGVAKIDNGQHNKGLMILGGVVVLVVVLMVGIGIGNWHNNRMPGNKGLSMMAGRMGGAGMGDHRFLGGGGHEAGLDGPRANSANRTSGVVTAVSGSSFTIAGFGSTTNVETNNSTQYHGGNTVKVNDTVTAFGATNNGILTATVVAINP